MEPNRWNHKEEGFKMNAIARMMIKPPGERIRIGILLAVLLGIGLPAGAAVLEVPSQYATIQEAIDAASAGDVINIAAGIYSEQLDVPIAVTLQGSGMENTTIATPPSLAAKFTLATEEQRPLVYIHDCTGCAVQQLEIDGNALGVGNAGLCGLAFHNAGGSVAVVRVTGVREDPISAAQHGIGILAYNADSAPRALSVNLCEITDYQKGGIAALGAGLSITIMQSEILGPDEAGGLAVPYGIRVADDAYAEITDNGVYWHFSTGAGCGPDPRTESQAVGLLLDGADPSTLVEDNAFGSNDVGIHAMGESELGPNMVLDNRYAGLVLEGGSHTLSGCNIQGSQHVGVWVIGAQAYDTATLTDLCIGGPGGDGVDPEIVGVHAYATEPLDVTVQNCAVELWNIGIKADGDEVLCAVHETSLSSLPLAGFDNRASSQTQHVEFNWWGDPSGPPPEGAGVGILGDNVLVEPRLLKEDDSSIICGLQPDGSTVAAIHPLGCISIDDPVMTAAMVIDRTDNAEMRGYSVTFTLSAELDLADGLNSITEGDYLCGDPPTWTTMFQKQQLDPYTFLVDCAILGQPCGPTTTPGTLFEIDLKKRDGSTDGDGIVTVTNVITRDCINQSISAVPGDPDTIRVDTAPPVAVADLLSTQVKTGNDADGTTMVTLTFSAPLDADNVEVYRAPFGYYPEYDDDGGAVPALPTYPPAAPWEPTLVTTSGETDETTVRDYWYYVVYTWDECGNRSDVSNMTGGTLNYHLGDVAESPGDNDVGTDDISLLGSAYFSYHGDGNYLNTLDVGPTLDYSVDTRPTTDNYIGFDDLMIVAMNFQLVGLMAPPAQHEVPGSGQPDQPALSLDFTHAKVASPGTFTGELLLTGNTTSVKGLHAEIQCEGYEVLAVEQGALLEAQGEVAFFQEERSDRVVIDAARLGRNLALEGSGVVATIEFCAKADGSLPRLSAADLRDIHNQNPNIASLGEEPTAADATLAEVHRTAFLGVRPNPFYRQADIHFSLARETAVAIQIYDASGRLVRTLVDDRLPAGPHHATWDGSLNGGAQANSGIYLCSFRAADVVETHKMFHLR